MNRFFRKSLLAMTLSISVASLAAPAYAATYQVQENDSLWSIAQANQISLEAMINANLTVDADNLAVGQTLTLPVSTEHTYAVQKGDTFWKLARYWNIPLDRLMSANPDIHPLNLYPGLVIDLPRDDSAAPKEAKLAADKATAPAAAEATASQAAAPEASAPQASAPAPQPAAQANTVTTASGQAYTYSKVIKAKASAYSNAHEENGWGPIDYFGNPLELGTIAVDPSVIPMNSTVYITGYDSNGLPQGGLIGKATDQGSAIKGNKVDIFMPGTPDKVRQFGIQDVTVYILD